MASSENFTLQALANGGSLPTMLAQTPTRSPSDFATYAEYIRHIDPFLVSPGHEKLVSYLDDQRRRSFRTTPDGWVLRIGQGETQVTDCSIFKDFGHYRRFLVDRDPHFDYQVVVRYYQPRNLENKDWLLREPFHYEETDTLGAGLNVPAGFWCSLLDNQDRRTGKIVKEWTGFKCFIHIGGFSLVLARSQANDKLKNVLLFIKPANEIQGIEVIPAIFAPLVLLNPLAFHQDVIVQGVLRSGAGVELKRFERRCQVEGHSHSSPYKTDDVVLLCLIGLLRLNMAYIDAQQAAFPCLEIRNGHHGDPSPIIRLDPSYKRAYEVGDLPEPFHTVSRIPISTFERRWALISSILFDARRSFLEIPKFVHENVLLKDSTSQSAYRNILKEYERHLRCLEMSESLVKDQIEMLRSAFATEMARQSIKESKRVILLTVLAFVFLPFSLAGTIFGMNIQQINSSGPDIQLFIATSFALLAFTFLMWMLTRLVVSQRHIIVQRYEESNVNLRQRRTWKEKLLFIGRSSQF